MRGKIQANGDERKAGSPKHHDSQKAQGGTDVHCSSAKLRLLAEIWRAHSNVIRPIIAVLIQISANAAKTSCMESRPKSVGEVELSNVAGAHMAAQKESTLKTARY